MTRLIERPTVGSTPVFINADSSAVTISNRGPGTVYYGTSPSTSLTSYDATIASGSSVDVTSAVWVVASPASLVTTSPSVVGGSSALLGFSEQYASTVTSGTAITGLLAVTFAVPSTASLVEVDLRGGTWTAAGVVTATFDLYDPIAGKVLRQAVLNYVASSSLGIPRLSRVYAPTAVEQVIYARVKASANVALTLVEALTSPDESPLQLTARVVA